MLSSTRPQFREITAQGHYMIAEGVIQKTGEHGAQIYIMEPGALLLES